MGKNKLSYATVAYVVNYDLVYNNIMPKFSSYKYMTSKINYYRNNLGVYLQLGNCAKGLLIYLSQIMPANNAVNNTKSDRKHFIDAASISSSGKIIFTDRMISNAFTELYNLGFLLRRTKNTRISYIVNPEYCFNGTESKRKQLIKKCLEFKIQDKKEEIIKIYDNEKEVKGQRRKNTTKDKNACY